MPAPIKKKKKGSVVSSWPLSEMPKGTRADVLEGLRALEQLSVFAERENVAGVCKVRVNRVAISGTRWHSVALSGAQWRQGSSVIISGSHAPAWSD